MNNKYLVGSVYLTLFLIPITSVLNYKAQVVAIILFLLPIIIYNAKNHEQKLSVSENPVHLLELDWGKILTYIFWGMATWSAIALIWSEAGIEASTRVFKQLGFSILLTLLWRRQWGANLFQRISREMIIKILCVSFTFSVGIFFYRHHITSSTTFWGEGPFLATLTLFLIATIPIFWNTRNHRKWTIPVWVLFVVAISLSANDAVKIALIAAILAYGLVLKAPKLFFPLVAVGSLILITIPLTYCLLGGDTLGSFVPGSWLEKLGDLDISYKHRLAIYKFTLEASCQQFWAGWGVGSTTLVPGSQESMEGYKNVRFIPSHPHNMPLQVMLETGAIGLTFVIAICVVVLALIKKTINNPHVFAAGAGLLVCYLTIASLSYSAWASWFQITGIMAALVLNLGFKSQSNLMSQSSKN